MRFFRALLLFTLRAYLSRPSLECAREGENVKWLYGFVDYALRPHGRTPNSAY